MKGIKETQIKEHGKLVEQVEEFGIGIWANEERGCTGGRGW